MYHNYFTDFLNHLGRWVRLIEFEAEDESDSESMDESEDESKAGNLNTIKSKTNGPLLVNLNKGICIIILYTLALDAWVSICMITCIHFKIDIKYCLPSKGLGK